MSIQVKRFGNHQCIMKAEVMTGNIREEDEAIQRPKVV
jgi:hypothetical protein